MLDWLRRRRLSNEAKRKLLIVTARSEEALIETHVKNVQYLMRELAGEVDLDKGLELYMEMIPMDEHVSETVMNRVLSRHESGGGRAATERYRDIFRDGR